MLTSLLCFFFIIVTYAGTEEQLNNAYKKAAKTVQKAHIYLDNVNGFDKNNGYELLQCDESALYKENSSDEYCSKGTLLHKFYEDEDSGENGYEIYIGQSRNLEHRNRRHGSGISYMCYGEYNGTNKEIQEVRDGIFYNDVFVEGEIQQIVYQYVDDFVRLKNGTFRFDNGDFIGESIIDTGTVKKVNTDDFNIVRNIQHYKNGNLGTVGPDGIITY